MNSKKNLVIFALALISGSAMAQSKDGVKFGVRAGVNLSKPALTGSFYDTNIGKLAKDNQKTYTSFVFGGFADIPVSELLSIQPGLSISGKGNLIEYQDTNMGFTTNYKNQISLMYIEMPINAILNFGGFYVGAGPYIAYAIAGKTNTEVLVNGAVVPLFTEPERNVKFGSANTDDINPFDFGANILAGYRLKNGFNVGLNYGLGIGNNVSEGQNDRKASNRVASVLVGFSF